MGNNPWGAGPTWGNPGYASATPASAVVTTQNMAQTGGGPGGAPWGGSNMGNGAQPINRLPMHSDMDLQLYSPDQLNRADWFAGQLSSHGPWQPWMTDQRQFLAAPYRQYDASYSQPGSGVGDMVQRYLDQYRNIMGSQQDQANRASYFRMMGSGNVGGVVRPPPSNLFEGQRDRTRPGDPWGALNSMGIYSNYATPPTYIQNFPSARSDVEQIPPGVSWENSQASQVNNQGYTVNPWTGGFIT